MVVTMMLVVKAMKEVKERLGGKGGNKTSEEKKDIPEWR